MSRGILGPEEGAAEMLDLSAKMAAAAESFFAQVGQAPEVAGWAPGRLNLIGEHTDYTEGLVLPCAIEEGTLVAARRRADRRVIAHALDLGERSEFDTTALARRGEWIDYLQGVAFALREKGFDPPGLEITIQSTVPLGAGLSSSAALGVSVCAAWMRLLGEGEDQPRFWADVAHRGENHFVGVGCGILDQFASALGQPAQALRIDCRTREVQPVSFATGIPALLLAHSGVTRSLAAEGVYRKRIEECAAAWSRIEAEAVLGPEVRGLRDLRPEDLSSLEAFLESPLDRRVRHVVTENDRVDRFCGAMRTGDFAAFGPLMAAGQKSLRDDYEVSVPELDWLCENADAHPGVIGSRLTGAGLGGCTVHLVEADQLDSLEAQLKVGFERTFQRPLRLIRTRIGGGARSEVF